MVCCFVGALDYSQYFYTLNFVFITILNRILNLMYVIT